MPDPQNNDDPQPRDIALEQTTPEQGQDLEDQSEGEDSTLPGKDAGTPSTT